MTLVLPFLRNVIPLNSILKTHSLTYPDLIYNFADLWLKAHVQHAVGLVEHQVGAAPQVCLSGLQEID